MSEGDLNYPYLVLLVPLPRTFCCGSASLCFILLPNITQCCGSRHLGNPTSRTLLQSCRLPPRVPAPCPFSLRCFSQSGAKTTLNRHVTWLRRVFPRLAPVACFPALGTGCMCLLRVLIGPLRYLRVIGQIVICLTTVTR